MFGDAGLLGNDLMGRFPSLVAFLCMSTILSVISAAWWDQFLSMWEQVEAAVAQKYRSIALGHRELRHLVESTPDGDFAPGGDPANADWD